MQRGRRRKIEVPTGDTQPQFELGDTTEEIERRREREEREERERERGERRKRVADRGRDRWKRKKEERREREQIRILTQNQLNPDRGAR